MRFKFFTLITALLLIDSWLPAKADDLALFIKESMVNKAVSSRRVWEWKDEKQGIHLQLTDLKFKLKDGYIIGTANLHEFDSNGKRKNLNAVDKLIKRASNYKDLAIVQLITQVGLTPDHRKVILHNTKFTQFDNRFLPGFIENTIILSEINRRFAKEIDNKVIYEFPRQMPLEISKLHTTKEAIEVYGNLIMPCNVN